MRQPFHMTSGLRGGSTIITTLLRLGLPIGSLGLLSVRGRMSGKIYTIPISLVENSSTRFLVAAFGEIKPYFHVTPPPRLPTLSRKRCTIPRFAL